MAEKISGNCNYEPKILSHSVNIYRINSYFKTNSQLHNVNAMYALIEKKNFIINKMTNCCRSVRVNYSLIFASR